MCTTFAIKLVFALALLFVVRLLFLPPGTFLFVSSLLSCCRRRLDGIAFKAAYAPIIVAIVATTPMTMPAVSPFVRIGELFGAELLGWAEWTVVVECCVRTTTEGAVDVTRAAVWSDDELVDMNSR
jgi:hypothetical protein